MHEMWWISMGLKKSNFLATTEDGEQVHHKGIMTLNAA
jgi:hypothetical protein